MRVDGAAQGASTVPRRRRTNVLLAIVAVVVISAVAALVVWAALLARSAVGAAEYADPNAGAGSAVIHDDAWNMPDNSDPAVVYGDGSNLHAST